MIGNIFIGNIFSANIFKTMFKIKPKTVQYWRSLEMFLIVKPVFVKYKIFLANIGIISAKCKYPNIGTLFNVNECNIGSVLAY